VEEGLPAKQLDAGASLRLMAHDWPGNVRELENLMRRLAVLTRDSTISEDLIDAQVRQGPDVAVPTIRTYADDSLSLAVQQHLAEYFSSFGGALPPDGLYHRILATIERPLLKTAMEAARGNQIRAAKLLGVNRNTLRKKLQDLDINPGHGRSASA
jgi:two-component system nitrogen regulation response regulator GlnG